MTSPKKLNISAATVSRGLQDHPSVSKKTKKRINDLADQIVTAKTISPATSGAIKRKPSA